MRLFLIIFGIFFCFILFGKAADPRRCEQLSILSNTYGNDFNVSMTAFLQVSRSNEKNALKISNFTRKIDQNLRTANFDASDITICISDQCYPNFVKTFDVILENGVYSISAEWNMFGETQHFPLYEGIIDGWNLIFSDGSLFNSTNQCMSNNNNIGNSYIKMCCTSLKLVPLAPSNVPKCTNFKARSTISYGTNNTLHETISANFAVSGDDITAKGNTIDKEGVPVFAINGVKCQNVENVQYCYYSIFNQEKELFIQLSNYASSKVLVGRIILRNGQTLMEEGLPFTPSDNCQSFNGEIEQDEIVSQLCCTQFEGFAPTAKPTPTPSHTLTKVITKQCNQISVSAIDENNATVLADLHISGFPNETNMLTIKNFNIKADFNISTVAICVRNNYGETCQKVSKSTTSFILENKIVKIHYQYFIHGGILYDNPDVELYHNEHPFFEGIIDQGNFISSDGLLFDSTENKCSSFTDNTDSTVGSTFCCASFSQKELAIPTYYPLCTRFEVTSTFYNNITAIATVNAELLLSKTDITAKGSFTGATTSVYSINGYFFQTGTNNTQFGGFPIKNQNSEYMIHVQYFRNASYFDLVFVGRILLIEGQTFLEQGVILSASNECFNSTSLLSDEEQQEDFEVFNQMCCTKFADNFVATSPSPTTHSISISTSSLPSTTPLSTTSHSTPTTTTVLISPISTTSMESDIISSKVSSITTVSITSTSLHTSTETGNSAFSYSISSLLAFIFLNWFLQF